MWKSFRHGFETPQASLTGAEWILERVSYGIGEARTLGSLLALSAAKWKDSNTSAIFKPLLSSNGTQLKCSLPYQHKSRGKFVASGTPHPLWSHCSPQGLLVLPCGIQRMPFENHSISWCLCALPRLWFYESRTLTLDANFSVSALLTLHSSLSWLFCAL